MKHNKTVRPSNEKKGKHDVFGFQAYSTHGITLRTWHTYLRGKALSRGTSKNCPLLDIVRSGVPKQKSEKHYYIGRELHL